MRQVMNSTIDKYKYNKNYFKRIFLFAHFKLNLHHNNQAPEGAETTTQ